MKHLSSIRASSMRVKATLFIALLGGAALPSLSAASAPARTHADPVHISGSVSADCQLTTLPEFSFTLGVGFVSAPNNSTIADGTLGIRCSRNANVQIGMDAGLHPAAAGSRFGARAMKSQGGDYLGYDLCHDSSCSSTWNSTGFTYASASDAAYAVPVYARILTGQPHAGQGLFTDSVTVTVSF